MKGRPIRELVLDGDASHRGAVHGAAYHNEIRRYTAERVRLALNGSWAGRTATTKDALDLANRMLPAHQEFDSDLYEELEALAAASGITPAEALIVGGFTDFVDVVRASGGTDLPEEDDCTAVIVPDGLADGAGFLAQTWDMHDTATEHVTLIRITNTGGPDSLIFTTVGCLGQMGMNESGICIGINNLTASNGQVGVTWPFVVRKALHQRSLDQALASIMEADLAGAHNYLLFDTKGEGFNIEAMPGYRAVTTLGSRPLVHTNHCLDPKAWTLEALRPPELLNSSKDRLATATELLNSQVASGRSIGTEDLIALTREPKVICRRSALPHNTETAGAAIMRPRTGEFWACWGNPADNEFELFKI